MCVCVCVWGGGGGGVKKQNGNEGDLFQNGFLLVSRFEIRRVDFLTEG